MSLMCHDVQDELNWGADIITWTRNTTTAHIFPALEATEYTLVAERTLLPDIAFALTGFTISRMYIGQV